MFGPTYLFVAPFHRSI